MVFSGTAATYGHGKAVVTATGMRTEMGRIAGLLEATPDETTPLQRELDRTGKMLGLVVVAIAVVMIVTIVVVEDVRERRRTVRCAHPRRRAGRRGGSRRASRRRDRRALDRRAAHGEAQRHRPAPGRGRDPRLGHRHRVGQDRHAHEERDDGARGRDRERARDLRRLRLCAAGCRSGRRRATDRRTAARRSRTRARGRRPREQRLDSGGRRPMDGAGRSDGGRVARRGAEVRAELGSARRASSHASERCRSPPSAS